MLHRICCYPGEAGVGGGGEFLYNSAKVLSFQRKIILINFDHNRTYKSAIYHECALACQYSAACKESSVR